VSHEKDLCRRGLHSAPADGATCLKCKPVERCSKGHDLSLPDATYTPGDGRSRCRECKRERGRRSRARKKRREAEEARGATEEAPTVAMQPRGLGRVEAARYRHAVMVRKARGLL